MKLKNIGKITTGKTPSKKVESAFGNYIQFLTPRDFNGQRYSDTTERSLSVRGMEAVKNAIVKGSSISVTCIGSDMGKTIFNKKDIVSNQQINSISDIKSEINPMFLYYLLCTKQRYLHFIGSSQGSTMPILNKRDFGNLTFKFPTRSDQDEVVNKINILDSKIELNNQINDNLFKLAKIHFDRQLDSENIKFSQISTIQNGYAFKSKEYVDTNELMILRTKNINDNHLFSKNDVVYISKELFDEYKRFSFSAFDTVLVMVGASIGKTGFVTSNMTPSLQNQNMWRFRPKMSNIPGILIFQYVNYINKHIIGSATGSARSFYRKKLFSEFEVPRINSTNYIYFDTLQREIDHLNTENEILYRIKHSLLNHYF